MSSKHLLYLYTLLSRALLGKIKECNEVGEIEELVISDELACNVSLTTPAYFNAASKRAIGRLRSMKYEIYRRINALEYENVSKSRVFFICKSFSHLGIELNRSPKKNEPKVNEIGEILLKNSVMKHEEGHYVASELGVFPLNSIPDIAKRHRNVELEDFVHAVHDSLADTIEMGAIKGRYPSIFSYKARARVLLNS